MLKEILSITGKPGLYKLVSQGKNMLIVESLVDGKRIPAYAKDKAVSLGDIAIFTQAEEVPLGEVLEKVKAKENGEKCSIDPKSDNDKLRSYMGEILPEYDKDRVYPSDIRKMLNWYNILIECKMTDFLPQEEEKTEEPETEGKPKAEVKEKSKKETKAAASANVKQPKGNKAPVQRTTTNRKVGS